MPLLATAIAATPIQTHTHRHTQGGQFWLWLWRSFRRSRWVAIAAVAGHRLGDRDKAKDGTGDGDGDAVGDVANIGRRSWTPLRQRTAGSRRAQAFILTARTRVQLLRQRLQYTSPQCLPCCPFSHSTCPSACHNWSCSKQQLHTAATNWSESTVFGRSTWCFWVPVKLAQINIYIAHPHTYTHTHTHSQLYTHLWLAIAECWAGTAA